MQVDFYQLSRDPVEAVVPLLAAKALDASQRLLVVHEDAEQRAVLSEALWARENAFLAHGDAAAPQAERQPILLAGDCTAANGAGIVFLADGAWREEAAGFERAILLFGAEQTAQVRTLWTTLSGSGHALRIFKQREDGSWREGR